MIVWDRPPAHRSRFVGEFLDSLGGLIATDYLPPYAPELNPVEYLWGYWKHHVLPNVCPKDFWELNDRAAKLSDECAAALASSPPFGNSLPLLSNELY